MQFLGMFIPLRIWHRENSMSENLEKEEGEWDRSRGDVRVQKSNISLSGWLGGGVHLPPHSPHPDASANVHAVPLSTPTYPVMWRALTEKDMLTYFHKVVLKMYRRKYDNCNHFNLFLFIHVWWHHCTLRLLDCSKWKWENMNMKQGRWSLAREGVRNKNK